MAAHAARPIVKIYLAPNEWGEREFKTCCEHMMKMLSSIKALNIKSFDDLFILFPTDRMKWGVGTEVPIEVDLPIDRTLSEPEKSNIEDTTARVVVEVIQELIPDVYAQCKVYWYDGEHGFWSTKRKEM